MRNPFLISGYRSPSYFCNRKMETKRIVSAIRNNRNLTLFSQRRLGKTGLLHHVFYILAKEKEFNLIYIDIFATKNLNQFVNEFAQGVFVGLTDKSKSIFDRVGKVFKSIKPSITYDPLTGAPSINFNFNSEDETHSSLNTIFALLAKSKKSNVIVIDEFQQVLNYPNEKMEALLRMHIQKSNNSTFIFSGSQKHLLLSMFGEYNRPFYQSSELMQLGKIDKAEYKKFIHKKFQSNKINIEPEAIDFILEWTKDHTYYVQYVCNKLFSSAANKITLDFAKHQCSLILEENEPLYLSYRNLLSSFQWELLKAIALEGEVIKITSNDFILKYKLNSPSSVQRGIKSLIAKELITFEDKKYFLQDIFFSRWFGVKFNSQIK